MLHDGTTVHRVRRAGRRTPSTSFFGVAVRTLDRPRGDLLCRFATVNDVHFGEIEAGRIDDDPKAPSSVPQPGADPIPR